MHKNLPTTFKKRKDDHWRIRIYARKQESSASASDRTVGTGWKFHPVRNDSSKRCLNDVDVAKISIFAPQFCRNRRSNGAEIEWCRNDVETISMRRNLCQIDVGSSPLVSQSGSAPYRRRGWQGCAECGAQENQERCREEHWETHVGATLGYAQPRSARTRAELAGLDTTRERQAAP